MSESKDFENKTSEKLNSELRGLKVITYALAGVLVFLFVTCIYGLIAKENKATFIALLGVGMSLSVIVFVNFGNMKKIKNELKSRGEGVGKP